MVMTAFEQVRETIFRRFCLGAPVLLLIAQVPYGWSGLWLPVFMAAVYAVLIFGLYIINRLKPSPRVFSGSLALVLTIYMLLPWLSHWLGGHQLFWAYSFPIFAFLMLSPRYALLLSCVVVVTVAPLFVAHYSVSEAVLSLVNLVLVVGLAHALVSIYFSLSHSLHQQSLTDFLTDARNRRELMEKGRHIVAQARKLNQDLALVLLDIDHFKLVNDQFGHLVGDEVLKEMVALIRTSVRGTDVVYRYGGEEFVVLLPGVDLRMAVKIAEKIRRQVESWQFTVAGHLTLSGGVAELQASESLEQLINRADEALYNAKAAGRNQVLSAVLPALAQQA